MFSLPSNVISRRRCWWKHALIFQSSSCAKHCFKGCFISLTYLILAQMHTVSSGLVIPVPMLLTTRRVPAMKWFDQDQYLVSSKDTSSELQHKPPVSWLIALPAHTSQWLSLLQGFNHFCALPLLHYNSTKQLRERCPYILTRGVVACTSMYRGRSTDSASRAVAASEGTADWGVRCIPDKKWNGRARWERMQLCTQGIPDNRKERLDGGDISLRDAERISTQKETEHQKS